MPSVVQALADCLEAMRRGSDLDEALEKYPGYRARLTPLLEVVCLIHPLADDVTPSSASREGIMARLRELRARPALSPPEGGGEPLGAC